MPIVDPYDTEIVDPFDSPEYQQTKQKMKEYAETGSMLKETLSNYPGSFGRLVKGAAQGAYDIGKSIVTQPMETLGNAMQAGAENVLFPAIGGIQKAVGRTQGEFIPDYERVKNAIAQGPYGSMENYAQYVKENPAQAQADVALMLTGAGGAARKMGEISKLGTVEKIGKGLSRAGGIVEPLTAPVKVTGTAMKFMMPSRLTQKMYASSAKMATIMDPEVRQRISQKLLDAEVKLNTKGFKKLADDFESLWMGVDDMIDNYVATGANKKMTVMDLMKGISQWEERASLTGRSHVVRNVKRQFIRDLTDTVYIGNKPMKVLKELNAKQINRLKRDIYRELHSQYGKEMVPLKSEVKMAIAHNAMDALETMIPGIIPNNKTAAAYKELMDAIQKGVNRIENRDLFSIGMPVRAGGTAVLSEAMGVDTRVGGLLGMALGLIDQPSIKSKIAIRLNKLKRQGVKIRPTATAIKLGLAKYAQFKNEDKEEKRNPIYPQGWIIRK